MQIPEYLEEIRHAVEVALAEAFREEDAIRQLQDEISTLQRAAEDGYRRAQAFADDPDDDDGLATAIYWDTYFGADKDQHYKTKELHLLDERLQAHKFSLSAIAGTILTYARQCLSAHYGSLGACPTGRCVGGVNLRDLIWQGRNQALHWEEGTFSRAVEACFDKLAATIGAPFTNYKTENLALNVVVLLGWRTWEDFSGDLLSLHK